MYKDKLITLFQNLNSKFAGLAGYLSDRNLVLKSILMKEMREDFLLKERIQSMDELGGANVTALAQNIDLTPVSELMPPVSGSGAIDEDTEVPFAKGGVAGLQPIIDINATSLGSEPTNEPYQSLEESGATMPMDQAASAIVEDYEVDDKFKKAFTTALALPAKASAAGLADLFSKTPTTEEGGKIVKKNLKQLKKGYGLTAPDPALVEDEYEGKDGQRSPEDQAELDRALAFVAAEDEQKALAPAEEEDKREWSAPSSMLGQMLAMGMRATGNSNWAAEAPAKGDPLIPDFATAPGYMPGYIGDGKGFWGRMGSGLKKAGKTAFDMSPVGLGLKGAKAFKNSKIGKGLGGFLKGAGGLAKKAFKYTPMGMAMSAGSSIINKIRGGDQKTNLNELTENVISENAARKKELTKLSAAPPAQIEMPSIQQTKSGGSKMDQGGPESIPKVKYSPYFDEYAITSQF